MLQSVKRGALRAIRASGFDSFLARSRWRSERLLILGYHGISLEDEHEWNPELYMSRDMFAARLELLNKLRCSVLPLDEALGRLKGGTLPPRSVVLTFDDGLFDFHQQAMPLLKSFGFPASVYVTTFYSQFNRPVFYLACSYLLWKQRDRISAEQRARALSDVRSWLDIEKPSAERQHEKLAELAENWGADLPDLIEKRILHLMTPAEISDAAAQGFNMHLHTHRHRTPSEESLFTREVEQNRGLLREWTGQRSLHFCYPNGDVVPEFLPWLRKHGHRFRRHLRSGSGRL